MLDRGSRNAVHGVKDDVWHLRRVLRETGARHLVSLICASRRAHRSRFGAESDWLRFSILGGLLLTFSCFALAPRALRMIVPGDAPGVTTMFAGMTVTIFMIKIAKRRLYMDWLAYGASIIAVGYVQALAVTLSDGWPLWLLCFSLAASGLSRVWIGLTMNRLSGDWLKGSGYIAVIGSFFLIVGGVLQIPIAVSSIVAIDLLFQGIAIAGVSLSLLEARRKSPGSASKV